MIKVSEIYNDVALDDANKDQNGTLSYTRFNRYSFRAELRLLSWLTGDLTDPTPPEKLATQKSRDWLSKFIKKLPVQVEKGTINKPADYYLYRDLYRIIGEPIECADKYEEDELKIIKKPIELLDNAKFTTRCATYIERLKPKNKPISKLSESDTFEFEPMDIGSVVLEYYRYPVKAQIVTMDDTVYNQKVVNEALSTNYEWPEACRELLIWFICQQFSLHIREVGFQAQNKEAKP